MDYISREELRHAMYHAAFETDTDLQKWESGCWIRYKLFENVLEALPAADVVEVTRCKDCIYSVYPVLSSQMKCNKDGERWVFFDGYCDKAERRE